MAKQRLSNGWASNPKEPYVFEELHCKPALQNCPPSPSPPYSLHWSAKLKLSALKKFWRYLVRIPPRHFFFLSTEPFYVQSILLTFVFFGVNLATLYFRLQTNHCIVAWKRVMRSLHTTKDKISFTTPVLLGKKQKIAQGIQVNNFRHCLKRQSGYLHSVTCFVLYMQFSRKIAERIFNKQD